MQKVSEDFGFVEIPQLQTHGWTVIVLRECELKRNKFEETMDSVERVLRQHI